MKKITNSLLFVRSALLIFSGVLACGVSVAAPLSLPNEPLGTEAKVPPTIMFTVDESTSMWSRVSYDSSATYRPPPKTITITTDASNTKVTAVSVVYEDDQGSNASNHAKYYSDRDLATRSAGLHAFAALANLVKVRELTIPRIGFSTINSSLYSEASAAYKSRFLDPKPFAGAHATDFVSKIKNYVVSGATPLIPSMYKIGKKFEEYVEFSCQRNYHVMFTDGDWNYEIHEVFPGKEVSDVDGGTMSFTADQLSSLKSGASLYGHPLTGSSWPPAIRDTNHEQNTLSDYALHFWKTPLRTDMPFNVLTTSKDPATWPHVNFYGMSFGMSKPAFMNTPEHIGKSQQEIESLIFSGSSTWPRVSASNYSLHTYRNGNLTDMWHASINGAGRFVMSNTPEEFERGLLSILTEIVNLGGSRAGVGFSNPDTTSDTEHTYTVSFEPGWAGDVLKKEIRASGSEGAKVGQSAAENLTALLTVDAPHPEPWKGRRKVFTPKYEDWEGLTETVSLAAPFLPKGTPGGGSGDYAFLDPAVAAGTGATIAEVMDYLRGDRSKESEDSGSAGFRVRAGPLGDIVNAKPVVVTVPDCKEESGEIKGCIYDEGKNPGYEQFYKNHKNRGTMIYVGANDGMLHAFDKDLNEKWAFIPAGVLRAWPHETPEHKDTGLFNLLFREGDPSRPFRHYNYVDATPRATDAFNPAKGGKWHTLLIGGLGKGGTSYYALDVTGPNFNKAEKPLAEDVFLWEHSNPNMGYTFGRPIVTKTRAWGGKWMVILPSGLNNGAGDGQPSKSGDGKGRIFFLDAFTGQKVHEIATDEGSPNDPLGLAHIGGYVEHYSDQVTTAVYGGDQKGNLWRFNLEDGDPDNWTVKKMAVLKDRFSNEQWVTTEPWPQLDEEGNRWVFVGTGGFRNENDMTNTITRHTFYAFRDGDKKEADTYTGRTRADLAEVNSAEPNLSGDANKENGWFEDMDSGYHVDVMPSSAFYRVVYAANKYVGGLKGAGHTSDLCDSGLFTGRIYARHIGSASSALVSSGGSKLHYSEASRGVVDVTIGKRKDGDGKERITVFSTTYDGSLKGEADDLDVVGGTPNLLPIRANTRYINN